jgi:hypothetical protein
MRIDYFENNCGHLQDSDDATKALGTVNIRKGVKTVGDIRTACEGHPKDSSIYSESDGSGFFFSGVVDGILIVLGPRSGRSTNLPPPGLAAFKYMAREQTSNESRNGCRRTIPLSSMS